MRKPTTPEPGSGGAQSVLSGKAPVWARVSAAVFGLFLVIVGGLLAYGLLPTIRAPIHYLWFLLPAFFLLGGCWALGAAISGQRDRVYAILGGLS
jgi:hypothetical protein